MRVASFSGRNARSSFNGIEFRGEGDAGLANDGLSMSIGVVSGDLGGLLATPTPSGSGFVAIFSAVNFRLYRSNKQ